MNSPGADQGAGAAGGAIPQPASREEITDTPLWHMYDYDLSTQTFTLMRLEERIYRETSFLDQRVAALRLPTIRYELKHLAGMFPRLGDARGPMGFIFHVGHCGSTLLSRALGLSERVLPLREPMTLRTLSADERELDSPMSFLSRADWAWLRTTIIDTLARRFRPDQFNIVKATSTGNNLIAPIMDDSESHRAVLLYVPLETYLATMLGKRREGGDLWGQARVRMKDWMGIEETPSFSLHELRAPHFAVLSWMTSMSTMLSAREKFGPRTSAMNFEDLIADPDTQLSKAAGFFGLEDEAETIVSRFPQVSSAYSKQPDRPFTPEMRAEGLALTRAHFAEEIRTGMDWAQTLIARVPRVLPCADYLA